MSPRFPIDLSTHLSGVSHATDRRRNAYRTLFLSSGLVFGGLMLLQFVTVFPVSVKAFWPFSEPANAAAKVPMIHDPSISVLSAPLNPISVAKAAPGETVISDNALVAESGPAGAVAATAHIAPSRDQISVYVVREGDTLSEIAGMFNVSINTIVWANDLGSARAIRPGQTLVILPVSGIERTVAKGDTLNSIAKKYGADAQEIADYNGLEVGTALAVGTTIIIPGGEIPVVASPAASAKIVSTYRGGSGTALPGYFAPPVPGARLTQGLHGWNGVDLGAPSGTAVRAAAGGTVIVARAGGAWNGGYGNYVVVSHANGTQTLYSHLSTVAVRAGQVVEKTEVIGTVGSTGRSTGPHLHFEVRGAKNPCAVSSSCQL